MTKRRTGFTLLELVIVILVVAIAIPLLMQGIYEGIKNVVIPQQVDRAFLLANEQLEVIRNSGYWIDDIDTASPTFPGNPFDLAEQWKARLDVDNRSFSASADGKVEVTFLKGASLTPFAGAEFDGNEPREKRKIRITVDLDGTSSVIDTFQMTYPTKERLLAILRRIKLALFQFEDANSFFPASGGLDLLVPGFLAEIPNDPYTTTLSKITHIEEEVDYSYTNAFGVRTLFALSHPTGTDPDMTLTW